MVYIDYKLDIIIDSGMCEFPFSHAQYRKTDSLNLKELSIFEHITSDYTTRSASS
jgi:hypothetical protein